MKKKFLRFSALGIVVSSFFITNVNTGGTNVSLKSITNVAIADCETVSGLSCKQIWCSSTYTYGGCGSGGNGNDCSSSKSCS